MRGFWLLCHPLAMDPDALDLAINCLVLSSGWSDIILRIVLSKFILIKIYFSSYIFFFLQLSSILLFVPVGDDPKPANLPSQVIMPHYILSDGADFLQAIELAGTTIPRSNSRLCFW